MKTVREIALEQELLELKRKLHINCTAKFTKGDNK